MYTLIDPRLPEVGAVNLELIIVLAGCHAKLLAWLVWPKEVDDVVVVVDGVGEGVGVGVVVVVVVELSVQ